MTNNNRPRFTIAGALLMMIFFVGLVLTIFEIYLYRLTIISWVIPFAVWLLGGLTLLPFVRKHLAAHLKMNNLFYQMIYSLLGLGGIVVYLMMAANYYGSHGETKTGRFVIHEKSSMPGTKGRRSERHPLVRFNYSGAEKELVFDFPDTQKVERADSVVVAVKNGGLGFDVIDHFDVIE